MLGRAVLLVGATVVLVGIALRVAGAGRGFPAAPLMTVLPYVALLGVVLAVVAARTGARWLALTLGVALLLYGGLSLPRVLPSPQPDVDGPTVTVAIANLFVGDADADALVAVVDELDVDLLVTVELTGGGIARLAEAGLDDRLPHRVLRPSARTSGGGLHSRWPLERGPDTPRGPFGATPTAVVAVPDTLPVDLHGIHPLPPISADWTAAWAATLEGLPTLERPVLRILAGDFNADRDHAPFRRLLRDGYVDAAAARGLGWRPTFFGIAEGDLVPPVVLDHVLVDPRIAVEQVRVRRLADSDHRMVIARLRLPAA